MRQLLYDKLTNKNAVIGIVGLGYVGLPIMLSFAEAGFKVVGFDVDPKKVELINKGETYIKHIGSKRIHDARQINMMEATADFSRSSEPDALILCVPTPLNDYREPDMSFIVNTMDSLLPYLRKGQIISLESTTYPGTTDELLKPQIEAKGFTIGEDVFLVFAPEREDPGNKNFTTRTTPKVVGGVTPNCLELGVKLYEYVINQVVPVSSTKAAELTKLLENIYRAVNIGLVNELKMVADKMGIDIWEVIRAASTKPFGFTPFYPGPGWGGHCIPIDPFYLTWKAREYDVHTKFIELAGEINTNMPEWVVTKIADALNDRVKSIKNSDMLILGLSYKKNIDDIRESPAVKLMEILRAKGANLTYSDPYIQAFPPMRKHAFDMKSVEINPEMLSKFDCVILVTDHDNFDYEMITKNSKLVIDTRGKFLKADNVVSC